MSSCTELAKKVCPRLRDLATVLAGGITQPRTYFFGQLCTATGAKDAADATDATDGADADTHGVDIVKISEAKTIPKIYRNENNLAAFWREIRIRTIWWTFGRIMPISSTTAGEER